MKGKKKMTKTMKKCISELRAAGRAVLGVPYWAMALLSTAAQSGDVKISPTTKTTRFLFTNPKRPAAGPTLSLPALFPAILAGTIDGVLKAGLHFAVAARMAGVAGCNATTADGWRTVCERYGVGYDDVKALSGPMANWYRDDTVKHTPTAFKTLIETTLAEPEPDTEPEPEPEPDTDTETETNPLLALVYGDGFPKRGDKMNAMINDAFDRDDGGAFYRLVRRCADVNVARVEADATAAATLAPTG